MPQRRSRRFTKLSSRRRTIKIFAEYENDLFLFSGTPALAAEALLFFDMGRDHNYLDDLTNRSIMQKVARECYLPMNALLFNLIRQSEGRFRCTFR